jgi:queuosine precursor transporter
MFDALIYIAATLASNYMAAWFVPLPIFGLVSIGTLTFGVTFTQRDKVHHFGRRAVYAMILAAAVLNVLESVFLGVSWRVILASFTAIILAEAADTEVYQRLMARPWLQRVAGSNAVSIPLDTILFTSIAFAGVFPLAMLISIMFGDIIVKAVISGLVAFRRGVGTRTATPAG